MRFVVTLGGRPHGVDISGAAGRYRVAVRPLGAGAAAPGGAQMWEVDAHVAAGGLVSLLIDGVSYAVVVTEQDGGATVDVRGEPYAVQVEEETRYSIRTRGGAGAGVGGQTITAPLPGRVTHVVVRAGDEVKRGDTLLVIEAMKMENEFKAAAAGRVREVRVEAGQAVNAGDVLLVIG